MTIARLGTLSAAAFVAALLTTTAPVQAATSATEIKSSVAPQVDMQLAQEEKKKKKKKKKKKEG